MRVLLCMALSVCIMGLGCATGGAVRRHAGLDKEAAEKIALDALRERGLPGEAKYEVVADREENEWAFRFTFEQATPGNAFRVWVTDDRKVTVFPLY